MLQKMKNLALIAILIALMVILAGCGAANNNTNTTASNPSASPAQTDWQTAETVVLTISAAASLTDALEEIKALYESNNNSIKLSFNFGASGALQQQIEQGAPADLFISAASKNMKALVDKQLIDNGQQNNLLQNELVVVVPVDSSIAIASMEDLAKKEVKHLAIGIPESVPAGNYAKEALTNTKLWDALQAKAVQAKDVRQVLQYSETGNADAGFVYKTDAMTSDKVKIAFTVDPAFYSAIEYPVGIVKATEHGAEAEQLYTFLQSQEALDIFVKYGFSVPS
ncbi:molybdate ABC transporter substrate-binding protein [Paenibacillus sp. N4]|uniref:molybdate ABC transporter substrate-binding protein n=1 Tax=Paenibacillus vietnamensis TaxID=2590547 RepID=UPI001CD07803|nr:molybdate ABC transporter substrate-binding protein [Paenibacillus vietnamensis]MCA0758577.1 molybdate ABC transporter substrate-binding protein [Paenibacillus vietnamensis]